MTADGFRCIYEPMRKNADLRVPVAGWPIAVLGIALLAVSGRALAAPNTATPRFEVATIKPSSYSPSSNLNFRPDGVEAQNMSLHSLMMFAFHLTSDRQLISGPKWVDSSKFEINGKVDRAVAEKLTAMSIDDRMSAYRSMIQELLAERFQLRVHHEQREMSVLALTVAKSGSKLKLANPTDIGATLHTSSHGRMMAKDVTMAMLANQLSSEPEIDGRMVVDKTRLTGKYDFKMNWTPEQESSTQAAAGPSLFTALEEQLGLQLKLIKAPVDVVVIDRVEMPSPN